MRFAGTSDAASSVSVTPSPLAAAAGRARPLVTDNMLTDAIRRARPSAARVERDRASPERGQHDGVQSPADEQSVTGGRRAKPRPVTITPTSGSTTSAGAGDGTRRPTRDT